VEDGSIFGGGTTTGALYSAQPSFPDNSCFAARYRSTSNLQDTIWTYQDGPEDGGLELTGGCEAKDGDLIVFGVVDEPWFDEDMSDKETFVIKLNKDTGELVEGVQLGPNDGFTRSLGFSCNSPDGNLLIAGYTNADWGNKYDDRDDCWIVKVDTDDLSVIWATQFGKKNSKKKKEIN